MMEEKFARLLLGEDLTGTGLGVSTAVALSHAITNLPATLLGENLRLEPLPDEKKLMWRREMDWLLSVCDHIRESCTNVQTYPDGSQVKVFACRKRSDIHINLPPLRKIDDMLLETLEGFENTEFWYVMGSEENGSTSSRKPLPRVPVAGLSEEARKQLQNKRDSTEKLLKVAVANNRDILTSMNVPDSYMKCLPKFGKAILGSFIYRDITSERFDPEYLLNRLDLSSEIKACAIANRIEASICTWTRRRNESKTLNKANRSNSLSERRGILVVRAEFLLSELQHKYIGFRQTDLDMCKIECNTDVGKSILESYSRVLALIAFTIIGLIDDLLKLDDLTKHSNESISISKASTGTGTTTPKRDSQSSCPAEGKDPSL